MKILLTGANGYIGQQLLPALLADGHQVACLVRDRNKIKISEALLKQVMIVEADLLKRETFNNIPKDFDAAYFLVHSMGSTSEEFFKMEQQIATNFAEFCEVTSAKQIIYLSGIANDEDLSEHLDSRLNVEKILRQHKVPVTVLRAAIIIGSGSSSYEIIRDLVEKLPVLVVPKWLETKCQPIAIRDVVTYLTGVLGKNEALDRVFDIGGPDILSYKEMMEQYAEVRGLNRQIKVASLMLPRISSYWLYFITSTPFSVARSLIESMQNEVVVKLHGIEQIVPIQKTSYKKAIEFSFTSTSQKLSQERIKQALYEGNPDVNYTDLIQVPEKGVMQDVRETEVKGDEEKIKDVIWRIGGDTGWYYMNWAWKLRGMMDKMIGGIGLSRGRKDPTELKTGDYLDFWRVLLADRKNGRLLLFAEMKLPGEAWLEFKLEDDGNQKKKFIQTATFRPKGILGRAYWYTMMPFHLFIFQGMQNEIVRRS